MLPKEVLKQIRRIEIKTGKLVNDVFSGQYSSVFKGRGMEFSEVREYIPGDDVRSIDWNVSARMGGLFIKKFVEERELTVIIMIDASASGHFGSVDRFKSEFAAEIAGLLAFSAIRNNDKVGMSIFTDQVEKYIAPKKGKRHILRLIREILYFKPASVKTDLEKALDHINEVIHRRSIVFIISDFYDHGYEKALRVTGRRHDCIPIVVEDPRERMIPPVGMMELLDAEDGTRALIDTRGKGFSNNFTVRADARALRRKQLFTSMGLDFIELKTDQSYIQPLIEFFTRRARRMR